MNIRWKIIITTPMRVRRTSLGSKRRLQACSSVRSVPAFEVDVPSFLAVCSISATSTCISSISI